MAMTREEMNEAWVQIINDDEGGRDSGCDSADEFVPVGNLEAMRDEDLDCSDSVCEDESGVVSSSDELAGRSSPEGSSESAGSDEVCFLCSSTEELLTDEEMGSDEVDPPDCFLCRKELLTNKEMGSNEDCFLCRKELLTNKEVGSDEGCFLCRKELLTGEKMGSDELDPSEYFVCLSTEDFLTDEEMHSSSIDSSANGDNSTGELPEGVPCQSPEE